MSHANEFRDTATKRTLWFSKEQNATTYELCKLTGEAASKVVRDALELYLKSIKKEK